MRYCGWVGIMSLGDPCEVCTSMWLRLTYAHGAFSAQGFLSFMSGYTVFLGPFAGIMVTDVGSRNDYNSIVLC